MEFIDKTVGQIINDLAAEHGSRTAVKHPLCGFELSFSELDALTDRIARGMMSLGIGKGDKVAIWATNAPEWLLTFFSAAKIGAILVTVNTNYKVFEAEYLLRQSDTNLLVMTSGFKDSNYVAVINELVPSLAEANDGAVESEKFPYLKRVVFAGEKEKTPAGMLNFWRLAELGDAFPEAAFREVEASLNCHEVINMQYTSGTTGFPKGVMLTHYNIVNNGKTIGDGMKFTAADRLCICVPLFHCFGLVLAVMASITHAAEMVIVDHYQPLHVMKAVSSERCTALHGVPTMFIGILDHPDFKKFDYSSLRTGIMAGSPCPVKVMRQVIDEMNMSEIVIVFGQTEASPGCTMTTTDDSIEARVSTVGRAFPGTESKIIDENNNEVPAGTPGEFVVRGYNIMKGYYKMPEATAAAIDRDGWLHTGDLCVKDDEGYYKVVGRIKDMIIRGGENIYPKEIEELLYTHPKVLDVQVVGVPSKQYGEEVLAVVIPREGADISEQEIKDFVKAKMSRHKVPSYVRFVKSFPVTASGKIQKYKLREEAVEIYKLHEASKIETA
jgi:fatty-acyl-CoA synthase